MVLNDLKNQLDLITRDVVRAKKRTGDGHTHTIDTDGRVTKYTITGVPQIEELEDAVVHALVDLWSLKDYLLEALSQHGMSSKQAEDALYAYVASRRALQLTADLANTAKHRRLRDGGWTRLHPRLGRGTFMMTLERTLDGRLIRSGMRQLTVRPSEIQIDAQNQNDPSCVAFRVPVLGLNGDEIGEACSIVAEAYQAWSEFLRVHHLVWPAARR